MSFDLIETIHQSRRGDHEALGRLYDQFVPLIRMVCFDQIGDYHAAQDTVQDVFFVMVKELHRLESPERFRSWLTGIARRKAIDCVRSRIQLRRRAQVMDEESAGPVADPDQQELLSHLCQAVRDLPEQERLAVQLFHLEDQSVSQVMAGLDLSRSAVYAVLIRARARLKERLARRDDVEVSHELP